MENLVNYELTAIMKDGTLKYFFGLLSIFLLIGLIYKLAKIPGGWILPGYFLGGIILIGVLIVSLVVTAIAKLIFKSNSFLTLFAITTSIAFIIFHYYLYSPTLKIIVPKGYTGEVNLVLSNVDDNILKLDSNGIGYVNKWTFDKTYLQPIVIEADGTNINYRCVGFNPSTFWGFSKFCCIGGKVIKSKSFKIIQDEKNGYKQFYGKGFAGFIDTKKNIVINDSLFIQVKIRLQCRCIGASLVV